LNRSRTWLLVVLVTLTLSSWLLLQKSDNTSLSDAPPETENRVPDFRIDQFIVVAMEASGIPSYRLQADSLLHFPSQKWSDLTDPRVQFYQQNTVNWHVSANKGRVYDEGENILLNDNVVLTRPASSEDGAMKVHTESLLVNAKSQTAETKLLARVETETHQLQWTGMRADMKKGNIKFMSDVTGVYRDLY